MSIRSAVPSPLRARHSHADTLTSDCLFITPHTLLSPSLHSLLNPACHALYPGIACLRHRCRYYIPPPESHPSLTYLIESNTRKKLGSESLEQLAAGNVTNDTSTLKNAHLPLLQYIVFVHLNNSSPHLYQAYCHPADSPLWSRFREGRARFGENCG